MLNASLAQNTIKAYSTGLTCFSKFRREYGWVEIWPPSVEQVTSFLSYLSIRDCSSNTARLYVASISFQCKIQSKQDITGHFLVSKVMEGFNRSAKKKGLRLPITIDILRGILTKLPVVCQDGFETSLFSAVYIIAFFGFFRVGELTVAKRGDLSIKKVLSISDICWIENNQSLLVTLRFSKVDQYGQGASIRMVRTGSALCPGTW